MNATVLAGRRRRSIRRVDGCVRGDRGPRFGVRAGIGRLAVAVDIEFVALHVVEDARGLEFADGVDVFPHLFGTNDTGWVLNNGG